jgi:ethanolamine transporter EutH
MNASLIIAGPVIMNVREKIVLNVVNFSLNLIYDNMIPNMNTFQTIVQVVVWFQVPPKLEQPFTVVFGQQFFSNF